MDLFIDTTFEAAHRLSGLAPGHKCSRLHGHSFFVRCTFRGDVKEPEGWIVDFDDLKLLVKTVIHGPLDHNYLNEVNGLGNPTSENLARWCWRAIKGSQTPNAHLLVEIQARESCTTGVIYRGENEADAM